MSKQLILLHGMGATSRDQWLPYLVQYFSAQDWHVVAPDVPNSNDPNLERWLAFLDEQVELTSETVLVGHSMGCPVILSLLERSNVKIRKAILVAGFIEVVVGAVKPILQDEYDWGQIKNNCEYFYFVNSDNDPYHCDDKQGQLMRDRLGGTQIIMAGEGHFGTSEFNQPYPEFPFLTKVIKD